MSAAALAARVEQYLAERRRLGFGVHTTGYALRSLVEHVRRSRHRGPLALELMAQWARLAKQGPGDHGTWARRLRLLRPFMRWLRQFEPATPVPEEPIFGRIPGRVAPHIYNDREIAALLDAAGRIGPPSSLRGTVVHTVFGLLACTGMRPWEYVQSTEGKLSLHFLPGYAPDLNPDELVWSHVKRTGTARRPLQAGEKLDVRIDAELHAVQRNPKLVRSFFQAPPVAYISDC